MHASETSGAPPRAEPALRAIAMPADANPHGDIFGGWLLSQMDLAGGTAAACPSGHATAQRNEGAPRHTGQSRDGPEFFLEST